jgi:plastocyanin
MKTHTAAIVFAVLSAAACGGGGGPSAPVIPPFGTPNSVVLTNNVFTPTSLSTTVGSSVTWTWNACSTISGGYAGSSNCVSHSIVFDDNATGSGTQSSGIFVRKFTTAGTFPYHCAIHGTAMSGQVVVQ